MHMDGQSKNERRATQQSCGEPRVVSHFLSLYAQMNANDHLTDSLVFFPLLWS